MEVHQNNKWNLWLRDQIATLIISAITSLVHNDKYKYKMLSFVPLSANHNFLVPVIDPVLSSLSDTPIVATEPDNKLYKPGEVSTSVTFRKLLNLKGFPKPLISYRLVKHELQSQIRKAVWDSLGIETIKKETVIECLQDKNWIKKQDFQWILLCYEYLRKSKFEKGTLLKCPIVPVKKYKHVAYTCDDDQPIYFECTQEDKKTLAKRPSCVDESILFLDTKFFDLIKDDSELKDWMTKYLAVYPFSIGNHTVDILNWLIEKRFSLSDNDLVLVSSFIVENKNKDTALKDLPVLLSNGERVNLGEIMEQPGMQLVVPVGYEIETGWQNIFISETDRDHLFVLSDTYLELPKEMIKVLFGALSANESPFLKEEHLSSICIDYGFYSHSIKSGFKLSDNEINVVKRAANNSTGNKRHMVELIRKASLSFISEPLTEQIQKSLVKWLSGLGKYAVIHRTSIEGRLQSKISYWYRRTQNDVFDSEVLIYLKESKWLNTTMGYCVPHEAFIKDSKVMEILADSVPYVIDELPGNILTMLGVNSDLGTDYLIELLLHHSEMSSGTTSFAEKVYITLRSRFDTGNSWTTNQQISVLHKGKSILVATNEDSKVKWAYPTECIWMDRSDIFGDKFIYLSALYPKLKDFFVSHLKVHEDVQDEHFGRLWLNIQEMPGEDHIKIVKTMSMIYERICVIIKSGLTNLDWLKQLKQSAKIYTESGVFEKPNKVFIPNDGKLKKLFDKCIEFTWLPEKTSYNQWSRLFSFFGIRQLKHSVSITLDSSQAKEEAYKNIFLTDSCKLLIAVWLTQLYHFE